jgi:hypothetical protein
MSMTAKEELAKLQREVDELKARLSPPKPFVSEPYERYDPTANMRMPASAAREMANAVPNDVVRNIALRDNRAPTGPSSQGAIPSSQTISGVRGVGGGWAREIPLGPSMHQRYVDAQFDAQDVKDRRELIEQKAREQAALKAMKP